MKIRIAVAVAKDGSWRACGWRCHDGQESIFGLHQEIADQSIEFLSEHVHEQGIPYHVVWVEVDVPLPPAHPVVEGTVGR